MYILPPPNIVTNSWYDPAEDGVAYEGIVDDEIAQKIASKEFKGVSIELDWLRPGGKVEFMNGVAPRNFELTSVHLLRKFPPGDRDAYVKFWNAIMEQLVGVGPARAIDDRVTALEAGFIEIRTALKVINGKIDVLSRGIASSQVSSADSAASKIPVATIPLFEAAVAKAKEIKEQGMTKDQILQKIEDLQKQIFDNEKTLYPESTLTAEEKEQARTKSSQLYTELEAYRQALAELIKQQVGGQMAQSESEELKALKAKLAQTEGKLSEAVKKAQQASEHADIVALRKDLVEAQAKLADAERKAKSEKERYVRFHEAVEGTLPDRATELRWLGTGPKLFTEKVKRVLREFHPS